MNVGLMLPLFYEYARNVREGVLEWVDRHPGWRIIEIDPQGQPLTDRFAGNLHGAIVLADVENQSGPGFRLNGLPVVNCRCAGPVNSQSHPNPAVNPEREPRWAVTFDRQSISRLAVQHFKELGLEAAGYVGVYLKEAGVRLAHVSKMREWAREAGMRWAELDLGGVDPSERPEWIWEGKNHRELTAFLRDCPKPIGLLAWDDYVGAMICETAAALRLRVPDDIAVLGQGNRVVGRTGSPQLSSVIIPGRQVGLAAAARLQELLEGKSGAQSPPPTRREIPCTGIVTRASTGGVSLDFGIERAKRYFEKHALGGVTVQELAGVAGCSVKTLRTKFLEHYKLEIAKAVRDRRKSAALHYLANSDLEIAEIGRRCGFTSPPNFFNFVRRQTGGLGPAEYRRKAFQEQRRNLTA